ncbi:dephospho-CoA kinase [Evansella cellulosilytica]|uniref:Dephospho-CoA kinase n=1 Tax=Evansella cellulosilytica (strain ATCC 21833 / DSM 2522 / FERM P-1141 / JCM 9156 / N-4) TaxID=649639 RepID=E6U0K8_EVAC2|nr:dephospho-CoA kinase [Evansella cellulosilytica]ADU31453.1 dephospho-CoA kinase [Evansella cellulosilytica DSM 2522]
MIIGLTGGIATGKSTVSLMLKEKGFPIVDADQIAKEAVMPKREAYIKIVETFGEGILLHDTSIDRKKLGSIIFKDEGKRKALNDIVHPVVRRKMKEETNMYKKNGYKTVILDIPLLIESNLLSLVEKVLLVYVPQTIQLRRLMTRDSSTEKEALSRIHAQIPIDEKKKYANAIIYNDGTFEDTKKQLNELIHRWQLICK